MLDQRQQLAELDRLQRQSNAIRRSLNGLRTGTRHVLELAAAHDRELSQFRNQFANAEPEEAEHEHEREAVHH